MALIAFDVDGPMADFNGGLCRGLRARGYNRRDEEILHWDLRHSLTEDEYAIADEVISEPGFCSSLEWLPGVKNVIRGLRTAGHDVIALTSPYSSRTWIDERKAWLAPLFSGEDILFVKTARKHLVRADILVEDHPGTCNRWLDAHPQSWAALVDATWNQPTSREFWPHARMARIRQISSVFSLAERFT